MYQGQAYTFAQVVPTVLESGIVNSLATFQEPTGDQTEDGSPLRTGGTSGDGFNDVARYVGIRCMDAPISNGSIRATENRSIEDIESSNQVHIWLAGNYPELNDHTNWRAVVTGANGVVTFYSIQGAEGDSQGITTRVEVEVVTV